MRNLYFLKISLIIIFYLSGINLFAQDRTIEITQQFKTQNSNKGDVLDINYKKTSPFVMLSGYTKDISRYNTVFYRIRTGTQWSEWIRFKKPHEGEDYDRFVFDAVFIENGFEEIQFKSETATESKFVFRLFFPEFTKNLPNNLQKTKRSIRLSTCEQPAFQGRSDWCPSGDCPKQSNPSIINPDHIVVHHSAGQTESSDYAAVVRSYWDFHVNTRGWADIGYNWLIDPNGVVYEGRGDRVRGAHSPCMNAISTGICYIGDYSVYEPAAAGLKALKDLIAWDATDKNIDVLASSFVAALEGDIENISGHRDGYDEYPEAGCTATECPGTNLYNKLQSIRNDVAAYECYIAKENTPDTPISFSVIRKGSNTAEINIDPVTGATKYKIYQSSNNETYDEIEEITGTSTTVADLTQGEVYYFKITAANQYGVSDHSSALAVMPSQFKSDILIIDGVERRKIDIISQYEYPMKELEQTFSSATNDAVISGLVNISDFKFVLWMLLDESTADETFNNTEQLKVKDFIDNDGIFIVSGNEIGWDLVAKGNATDKSFYENYLFAQYIADTPSPNNFTVKDNNNQTYYLDKSGTILDNTYPDLIKTNNGSVKTFVYEGVTANTGLAGVSTQTINGGVEYLAFAIEGITDQTKRTNLLEYILEKYSKQLSTENNFIRQEISLYPNPTTGLLKIGNPNQIQIEDLEIYNVFGQKLSVQKSEQSIDLHNLSNGIYFIRITDINGKQGTFKVLKQ